MLIDDNNFTVDVCINFNADEWIISWFQCKDESLVMTVCVVADGNIYVIMIIVYLITVNKHYSKIENELMFLFI